MLLLAFLNIKLITFIARAFRAAYYILLYTFLALNLAKSALIIDYTVACFGGAGQGNNIAILLLLLTYIARKLLKKEFRLEFIGRSFYRIMLIFSFSEKKPFFSDKSLFFNNKIWLAIKYLPPFSFFIIGYLIKRRRIN